MSKVDPFGYYVVGCKIGANDIRLHDGVVAVVARLFRSLHVDAIVESVRLLTEGRRTGIINNRILF